MSTDRPDTRSEKGSDRETRRGLLIRDLPEDERPRDRLLQNGGQALSDAEIISILLHSGRPGLSAVGLARELLRGSGGLNGLIGSTAPLLTGPGVGPGKAAVLLAAIELAARLTRSELPERHPLREPAAVARYLSLRYGTRDQEIMGALYLDTRHRLLEEAELFRGTLDRATVEPRSILKRALLIDSPNLIVFHTHPSGDPAPSAEDLAFTKRLAEAGEIVGVRLLDHLILGSPRRWVSLKERGAW